MHAGGIWCKTKIQIDHGGLEVNFSLQAPDIFAGNEGIIFPVYDII
jgi:hypothetical protein